MATYRTVVKSIETLMKKNFDDADITTAHILYYTQVIANKLRRQYYEINQTGSFVSTFSSVPVQKDNKSRHYIDLPEQIMDLPNDSAIRYITYNYETGCCCSGSNFAQVFFQPVEVGSVHRLYYDEYEKPSPKNPYFYRIGSKVDGVSVNRIYFVGTECVELKDVEIAAVTTLDPKNVCNLDDILPIPDSLIDSLEKEVISMFRFSFLFPEERKNEGEDESESGNTPKIEADNIEQQQNEQ